MKKGTTSLHTTSTCVQSMLLYAGPTKKKILLILVTMTGGSMAEQLDCQACNNVTSCCNHYLELFQGSPEFNSSIMLVNSQLVCLLPVGILNLLCYILNIRSLKSPDRERIYLLLTELEVCTVSYGLSFFPFAYGPSAKRVGHKSMVKNKDP